MVLANKVRRMNQLIEIRESADEALDYLLTTFVRAAKPEKSMFCIVNDKKYDTLTDYTCIEYTGLPYHTTN